MLCACWSVIPGLSGSGEGGILRSALQAEDQVLTGAESDAALGQIIRSDLNGYLVAS